MLPHKFPFPENQENSGKFSSSRGRKNNWVSQPTVSAVVCKRCFYFFELRSWLCIKFKCSIISCEEFVSKERNILGTRLIFSFLLCIIPKNASITPCCIPLSGRTHSTPPSVSAREGGWPQGMRHTEGSGTCVDQKDELDQYDSSLKKWKLKNRGKSSGGCECTSVPITWNGPMVSNIQVQERFWQKFIKVHDECPECVV